MENDLNWESNEDTTGLLQRLQELKVWQKEQEHLLEEHGSSETLTSISSENASSPSCLAAPKVIKPSTNVCGDCDSVELSFIEKLEKMKTLQEKEKEDLEAFEIIEAATTDFSFSSNCVVDNISENESYSDDNYTKTSTKENKLDIGSPNESFKIHEILTSNLLQENINENYDPKIGNTSLVCPSTQVSANSSMAWCELSQEKAFTEQTSFYKEHPNSLNSTSPLSNIPVHTSLNVRTSFNHYADKLEELEKEINKFKKENEGLIVKRRKLFEDKKKLATEIEEFEKSRAHDRRKIEEERKRLKRDTILLEKMQKDIRQSQAKKTDKEIEDLLLEVKRLNEEGHRKELKWKNLVTKLQKQIKVLEKENQKLHEENHKLKLKHCSSKIFQGRIYDDITKRHSKFMENAKDKEKTLPDLSEDLKNTNQKTDMTNAGADTDTELPPFTFSAVDSLESNITLVEDPTSLHSVPEITNDDNQNSEEGTIKTICDDGSVEEVYANGNRKITNSQTTKILYYNGDLKITECNSNLVKYYYAKSETWHFSYPGEKEIFKFQNGQEEVRYPDGTIQISFADGSFKTIFANGSEKIQFLDGTNVHISESGDKTLYFPNGQIEVHTENMKKREYLDGTIKILYNDGKQETRYSSGRVRIKDKNGTLIHDSEAEIQG